MSDNTEFSEGDNKNSAFEAAVLNIRNGRADFLPSLDSGVVLQGIKDTDTGLVTDFAERTRRFLENAFTLTSSEMSEPEITKEINNQSAILTGEGGSSDSNAINLQILSLGALIFVGGVRRQEIRDPKTEEAPEMTAQLRRLGSVRLSDFEREILLSLATGFEIGYGQNASNYFERLISQTISQIGSREKSPDLIGDDLCEALLKVDLRTPPTPQPPPSSPL